MGKNKNNNGCGLSGRVVAVVYWSLDCATSPSPGEARESPDKRESCAGLVMELPLPAVSEDVSALPLITCA